MLGDEFIYQVVINDKKRFILLWDYVKDEAWVADFPWSWGNKCSLARNLLGSLCVVPYQDNLGLGGWAGLFNLF